MLAVWSEMCSLRKRWGGRGGRRACGGDLVGWGMMGEGRVLLRMKYQAS